MPNASNVAENFSAVNVLAAAGFRVRGRRAACPYCDGHSRLTVSFTSTLWYCHRCHRGGNFRTLAKQQGLTLPRPRIRRADIPKNQFRLWLSQKMSVLADEERRAHKMKEGATAALSFYPDLEVAWNFLAWFYGRRHVWETFWQSASDNVGRFYLYKAWRRHNRVA